MADTVATLRPNAVVSVSQFTVTGAADAATALNDNSDASWVNGSGSGAVVVDMTTVAVPALAQVRSLTPRTRSKPGGVIVATHFQAYLAGVAGADNVVNPVDNTNIYNYAGSSLTTRPTDGAAWAQADIDAVQWRCSGAGTNYYEAYIDVAYNQAPVATPTYPARTVTDGVTNSTTTVTSATAFFQPTDVGLSISGTGIPAATTIASVTNSTTIVLSAAATASASGVTLVIGALVATSNKPPIIWNYTDPESDSQERFRVKIFTAAQVSAPGFAPETSTPLLDSGETFSSSALWTPTTPLSPGTTYTPYVKVADSGSGGRYGNWAAGTPFSIAPTSGLLFDLPAVPIISSVTPDSANNRVAVVVQGIDNELTRNQSSVESSIVGWEASANLSALARDTTQVLHGVSSMKLTSTAAGDMAARTLNAAAGTAISGFQNSLVPVLAGLQYTALASFRSAVSARSCRIDIRWYDHNGTLLSTSTGTSAADTTSGWTQVSNTATAPAGSAFAGLLVTVLATGAASEVHWVDQVDIGPGSSLTWTRGGFVQPIGALSDSFSRPDVASGLGVSTGGNMLPLNTASIETDASGWLGLVNCAVSRVTTQFIDGVASLAMTAGGSGAMTAHLAARVPVVGGQVYTALASYKAATTLRGVSVSIGWYDVSSALLRTDVGATVNDATTGWTQVALGGVIAPTNAVTADITLQVLAVGAAEVHWVDNVGFFAGTTAQWAPPLVWNPLTSTWGVQNGRAYVSASTVDSVAVLATTIATDGVLTCDVTLSPTANHAFCGVVLRAADASNFLLAALAKLGTGSQDAVTLSKRVAGTTTQLNGTSSEGLVNGATYGLKVELWGGLVRVWLDKRDGKGYVKKFDQQLVAADLASYAGATNNKFGLWLAFTSDDMGSRFDNFAWSAAKTQAMLVQRSVDGGVTWSTSRTINRVSATDPGQVGAFFDYEAPRGVAVQYRPYVQAGESDQVFLSAFGAAVVMSPNLAQDGNAWLKSPVDPTKNVVVALLKDSAGSGSTEDQVVYAPLGRADYLIHGGTVRLEVFDGLQFLFLTDAAFQAFEALRKLQQPLLLQTCYGDVGGAPEEFWVRLGPTRAVTRTTMSTSTGQLRTVKIPARQVLAPVVV